MLRLENIDKFYGEGDIQVKALQNLTLEIQDSEFVAIMGHSGSGKSTLMNIIGALDRPTAGKYFMNDVNVADLSDDQLAEIRNQNIGFVFQSFNLLPRMSALKNVELPLVYANCSVKERQERAKEALAKVGLSDRMHHDPNELSGGQKQRVAIARALVSNPNFILADEPTGNLDTTTTTEIMELFCELNDEGTTIVMVTHEEDMAEYSKRVVNLRDGCLIQDRVNAKRRWPK